jgi:hypothetical protein
MFGFDPFVERKVMEYAGMKCVASADEFFEMCQYISINALLMNKL